MFTLVQRSQPVVLAMLGLTTLDNIAQLGVQATSLTDSPQEQQNQIAKILITLIITLAVGLLTCNSVQMRLQYFFFLYCSSTDVARACLYAFMSDTTDTYTNGSRS